MASILGLKCKPPVDEDVQDMGIQANQQDTENLKSPEVFGEKWGEEELWGRKVDKNFVRGVARGLYAIIGEDKGVFYISLPYTVPPWRLF